MSAALRAYADREAATRTQQQQQQQGGAATSGQEPNNFADADAPFIGKRVLIADLLARPDLNGKVGEAVSFSSASGRYTVRVNDEPIALRAANLSIAKASAKEADAFSPQTRVRIKDLKAKPEVNGCGGTIVEWNPEKERFVVEMDGSLQKMLFKAANLERDRKERWAPEMHTTANLAHIQQEQDRRMAEQAANANPLAAMLGEEGAAAAMKQQAERDAERAQG